MQQVPPNLLLKLRQRFQTGLTKSQAHREQQLQNLLKGLMLMQQEIVESIQQDLQQGFVVSWKQFAETQKEIKYILKNIKRWQKKSGTTDLFQLFSCKETIKQPKGIVAVVFDLPTANLLQRVLVSLSVAISAGNCVVLKINSPMENTNRSIDKLVHEFLDPFSIKIYESSLEDLISCNLDHIHYIGNQSTNSQIQKLLLSKELPPTFSYELCNATPAIIDSDADIDFATQQIVSNKWISAGQNLENAISQVYVHQSISNQFISKLKVNVEKQFGFDAQLSPDYARLLNGVENLKAKLDNSKIEHGGQHNVEQNYLAPTIIPSKSLGDVQGPILPIFVYEKLNKIVTRINDTNQNVNLYFFSQNRENQKFIQQNLAKLNNLYINTCFDLSHPFQTGCLRGSFGFDLVSRQIQVTKQGYRFLTFYPPFNASVQKQLTALYKMPHIPQKCFLQGLAGVGILGGLYKLSKRSSKN